MAYAKSKSQQTKCTYLIGALNTPNIGTFPANVAVFTVVVAILLLQELKSEVEND